MYTKGRTLGIKLVAFIVNAFKRQRMEMSFTEKEGYRDTKNKIKEAKGLQVSKGFVVSVCLKTAGY